MTNSIAAQQLTISRWTRATFWGWLLGIIFILLLSSLLDAIGIEHMQFYIGAGMGAGVGCTQWLLLRKHTQIGLKWIWASIAGMGIPFILLDLIVPVTDYKLHLGVVLGGIAAGVLQYFIWKKYFPKSALWIVGSFIGWTIAAAAVLTINYTMALKTTGPSNLVLALLNLFIILAGGLILGVIKGITFTRIK